MCSSSTWPCKVRPEGHTDSVTSAKRPRRGELRIYLGAAPGVGKPFAMLGEARRRLARGTAGIDVLSTVNVQHLQSLNDVVERITGVTQQETVPDEVVRRAGQLELVDITPEALRRRLAHGNVYPAERIDAALGNYFRPGNLTALRELALLWVADQVDVALQRYRAEQSITDTWEARERVVVSITGGAESETLIRRASRLATRAGAELQVLHILRGDGLSGIGPTAIARCRTLAEEVGATFHTVVGDDVPAALLAFDRGVNATQHLI